MNTLVERLMPGSDLKQSIESAVLVNDLKSGVILSLVGSLTRATLRMAGGPITTFDGPLEIVSATGTISPDGIHIHLAIADDSGTTYGGHLLPGCLIASTAEMILADLSQQWIFERQLDPQTNYKELKIHPTRSHD